MVDAEHTVVLSTSGLTTDDVVAVARHGARVEISEESVTAMQRARDVIRRLADDSVPHYGVSTGFGALASKRIDKDQRALLQASLVRSHAAGSGPLVEREVVRALMLLRLKTLCSGHTGVRPVVAQTYAAALNAGLTPAVHEYGSLGCSGDLAPLAHCALVLMGEGDVLTKDGSTKPGSQAMEEAGIEPLALVEKEGLALINGTDGMLGMLILALDDLDNLVKVADVAAAMSVESQLGTDAVFHESLHTLRPHPGQGTAAGNLRELLAGSGIVASHKTAEHATVQDAYSLRCSPQVHGAVRDTLAHCRTVAERELAASIDNPAVTDRGDLASNGNFHGAPVAYVCDYAKIAVTDLASISERRTDRAMDPARNDGLNAFLAGDPGVDSGLMIPQYTAAGLVSEMKRLASPASVDSIPSSAMQEDHVSMGWSAARALRKIVHCAEQVLAIELLTASRADDMRAPHEPSAPMAAAIDTLRSGGVAGPGPDRYQAPEMAAATKVVRDRSLIKSVESRLDAPLG